MAGIIGFLVGAGRVATALAGAKFVSDVGAKAMHKAGAPALAGPFEAIGDLLNPFGPSSADRAREEGQRALAAQGQRMREELAKAKSANKRPGPDAGRAKKEAEKAADKAARDGRKARASAAQAARLKADALAKEAAKTADADKAAELADRAENARKLAELAERLTAQEEKAQGEEARAWFQNVIGQVLTAAKSAPSTAEIAEDPTVSEALLPYLEGTDEDASIALLSGPYACDTCNATAGSEDDWGEDLGFAEDVEDDDLDAWALGVGGPLGGPELLAFARGSGSGEGSPTGCSSGSCPVP